MLSHGVASSYGDREVEDAVRMRKKSFGGSGRKQWTVKEGLGKQID